MAEDDEESMNISAEIIEDDCVMTGDDSTDGMLITNHDGSPTESSLQIEINNHDESQDPQIIDGDDINPSQVTETSGKILMNEQGDAPQIVMVSGPSHHVAMPTDQLGLVNQGQTLRLVTAADSGLSVENDQAQLANGVDDQQVTLTPDGLAGISIAQPLLVNMVPEALNHTGGTVQIADMSTLQNLLAAHGSTQFQTSNGETVQIITVQNPQDIINAGGVADNSGQKMWQILPTQGQEVTQILNSDDTTGHFAGIKGEPSEDGTDVSQPMQIVSTTMADSIASILMPPPAPPAQNLPPGCPTWAARLKDCEQIGDSFRGWVESEVELDLLLTYHKQQTQSFWGTRQSPSPAKQSTRLMWKSQYVPFDGIPFVNSGSRAIVMECQYGPRRKGAQAVGKSRVEQLANTDRMLKGDFKQTCPARIYIKKVKKFPQYAVDINMDKKSLKLAMDKAFQMLKDQGIENHGQERYYVQLPTEKSHEFHTDTQQSIEEITKDLNSRLHPNVGQKIRDMVSAGETRLYVIRKALRRFVEREMFESSEQVPEKHDLTFYPTVNDLQNHIHQAIKDIESGLLATTAPTLSVEGIHTDQPHAETVTVTLTQNPGEDGQHIISRVETHLSDGSTRISTTLTPETVQLLSKLHPNMFPAGSVLQLQGGPAGAIQIANSSQIPEGTLVPAGATLATDASISMNIQSVDSSVTHGVIHDPSSVVHPDSVPVVLHSATDVTHPESFTIIENHDEGQCSVYDDDGGLGGSSLISADITGDGSEQILTVAMVPDGTHTVKVEGGVYEDESAFGVDSS